MTCVNYVLVIALFWLFLMPKQENKHFSGHKCFIVECGYQQFGQNLKGNRFEVGSKLLYECLKGLAQVTCTASGDWMSQYTGKIVGSM